MVLPVIRHLAERLGDLRSAGLCMREIRAQAQRVGFAAVSLSGRRALLGHVRSGSRHWVRRYGVGPELLKPPAREELAASRRKSAWISEPSVGSLPLEDVHDGDTEQQQTYEEYVPKIKGKRGFRFIKELGGAIRRETVSKTARFLEEHQLLRGRILDYGCGFGFDADQFGWEAFDPHYRQKVPEGRFDTIVCNHVANMLTRDNRQELFEAIRALLAFQGKAYVSVSRKIPRTGKIALRKRIQNYVVLTLPSHFRDDELAIYRLEAGSVFEDLTKEIEDRL